MPPCDDDKTLIPNFPAAIRCETVLVVWPSETATMGGSSDAERNELIVQPTGSLLLSKLETMATPVGK